VGYDRPRSQGFFVSIQDFRRLDSTASIEADVCVIGSGPAGWTVAAELAESGLKVLVLESGGALQSGGECIEPEYEALNLTEDVGAPLFNGRRRTLGGTPEYKGWGSRCRALDDIDYQARPWVAESGWPIDAQAVAPFLDRASRVLGAGPHLPDSQNRAGVVKLGLDPERLQPIWWNFGQDSAGGTVRFARLFRTHRLQNLRVLTHATVTHLNVDPAGRRVVSADVSDLDGKRGMVVARAFVLCAGGVENARILLYSNRQLTGGLGNTHDLVGRYLIDHPRDLNMAITFDPGEASKVYRLFGPFHLDSGDGPRAFVAGLGLSDEIQRREQLLNCAAWPVEEISDDDPTRAAARLLRGRSDHVAKDLRLTASGIGRIMGGAYARGVASQPIRRKVAKIGLVVGSEQIPHPDSRVTLSDRKDCLDLPIARTDWRVSAEERASQAFLARTIQRAFERAGLPTARLADWVLAEDPGDVRLSDGCHPSGTTRMADDPRRGVVDANCKVHGLAGLYVAGSSIFPTNGHANPTLPIVALAMRLAHHLGETLEPGPAITTAGRSEAPTVAEAPDGPAGKRVAVTGASGFIGARLVETLVEQGATVTCLTRGPAPERLLRTGAEVCVIDLTDPVALDAALEGIDWIFHCAYDAHDNDWNFKTLRALTQCCCRNRRRRLVHVSSFVVYDFPAAGSLTEETIATTETQGYARIKLDLETELLRAVKLEGVAAAIVQPTLVYGPGSRPWTVEPVNMLRYGTVVLPDRGEGLCNAVFVDDVVDAMILAAGSPSAIGERFLISGDPVSWKDFYEGMARAAGLKGPSYVPAAEIVRANSTKAKLLRLLRNPDLLLRQLARRRQARAALDAAIKVLPRGLRDQIGTQLYGPLSRRRGHVHLPNPGHLSFLQSEAIVTSARARDRLGYRPKFDLESGLQITGRFLGDL
jgi:nucleoside-diphosphate-sugar epimerase/choline dehydrogenase-like flavoprotein